MDRTSRKISLVIFLAVIFILLVLFTAVWVYSMVVEQTAYSSRETLVAVECGRYYFDIPASSVSYNNMTLNFDIKNTIGSIIETIVVESAGEVKDVVIMLDQRSMQPVTVDIAVVDYVIVYPKGCRGLNFKNISFQKDSPGILNG
ncbi:hypothetical protein HQ545_04495 [Candidatus Woesearchaeota archaeon]|nr:hypothetical protein [Candidatus Woesearchaeota archaeon]